MKLLIENGILLREYSLPFNDETGNHVGPPDGWTIDDTPESVVNRAAELKRANAGWPDFACLNTAGAEYKERMRERCLPCPGWLPVSPNADGDIVIAYRNLFLKMTAEAGESTYPPDGHYMLRNGRMTPCSG